MTKRSSTAKKPAAAKAKPDTAAQTIQTHEGAGVVPIADAAPKIPAATGAEVKPEDAAAPAAGAEANAPETQTSAAQPEETAGDFTPAFIVTGPAGGFRRGGITFDRQPRELTRADFGLLGEGEEMALEQQERLLAILEEPRLTVVARGADGAEELVQAVPEVIEALRAAIAKQAADA